MEHIFKALEILEGDDEATNEYITKLLVSDRVDREGFTPEMFSTLISIQKQLKLKKEKPGWTF